MVYPRTWVRGRMPANSPGESADLRPPLAESGFRQRMAQTQTTGHQSRQVCQGNHVRTVAQCLVGARMGLDEDAIAAAGDRRLGEERNHAPFAVAAVPFACWFLYAVGGVKDHGTAEFLH